MGLNINMDQRQAYVKLLNEGTDVFRPVMVRKMNGYFIVLDNFFGFDEEWEFTPGSKVKIGSFKTLSGEIIDICLKY